MHAFHKVDMWFHYIKLSKKTNELMLCLFDYRQTIIIVFCRKSYAKCFPKRGFMRWYFLMAIVGCAKLCRKFIIFLICWGWVSIVRVKLTRSAWVFIAMIEPNKILFWRLDARCWLNHRTDFSVFDLLDFYPLWLIKYGL